MKNVLFCLDSFKGTLSTFDIISISKEVINNKYKSYFNGREYGILCKPETRFNVLIL